LSLIFQHWFPLLEKMKDGSKLLLLATTFTFQSSLDLFKHYDLILASKDGFILKMPTLLINMSLSNFNSKLQHVLQSLCLSNMLNQVVMLWC
jgi:hypothetical protein